MTVVQTQLPELEYELLRQRARSEHRPIQDVVRAAIRAHVLDDRVNPSDPIFRELAHQPGPPGQGLHGRARGRAALWPAMIFIDTSAWFALLCERAAQRPEATSAFAEIESGRLGSPATTDHVLDETFNRLRQRAGLGSVSRRALLLQQSPSVRRLRIGETKFEESRKVRLSRADKRWSFTNCTSFATMRATRISRAFVGDPNFAEAGLEGMPKPTGH